MEDASRTNYWCHICSQMVNPAMEGEIKCPQCQTGFIEEIRPPSNNENNNDNDSNNNNVIDLGSLAASMLLGLLSGLAPSRPRITDNSSSDGGEDEGAELRREIESLLGRRRSNISGPNPRLFEESNANVLSRERRPRMFLVNPVNQAAVMLHGANGLSPNGVPTSLGEQLIGPGLDLLLQHLAENAAGRYGSPPAQKEAIKALPKVCVGENTQCSVCLEDLPVGSEALEMPCKHNFHADCILSWLELHCSCPVCRRELPSDNEQNPSGDRGATDHDANQITDGEMGGEGRRLLIPIQWPFEGMLTLTAPQNAENSSEEPSPEHPNQN